MDNTKEFILQCEKAVEIQKEWKQEVGDWCYSKPVGGVICVSGYRSEIIKKNDIRYIWLPTQSQFQGMIINKYRNNQKYTKAYHMRGDGFLAECIMNDIVRWADSDNKLWRGGKNKWWKSMEQLCLAFVMAEKYKKHWNGTDWVKNG